MVDKNVWLEFKGVKVRRGMREGYWEVVVRKEDGSLVKMWGRKCGRFLSEVGGKSLGLGDWEKEEEGEKGF